MKTILMSPEVESSFSCQYHYTKRLDIRGVHVYYSCSSASC